MGTIIPKSVKCIHSATKVSCVKKLFGVRKSQAPSPEPEARHVAIRSDGNDIALRSDVCARGEILAHNKSTKTLKPKP